MKPREWGEHGEFDHLMASQQRELRRLIRERGELDEDDFVLTLGDGRWAGIVGGDTHVPFIVYEPAELFFGLTYFDSMHTGLEYVAGGHAVYFRPGGDVPDERHVQLEWPAVRRHFEAWLMYVVRELDLGDASDGDGDAQQVDVVSDPTPSAAAKPVHLGVEEGTLPAGPTRLERLVKWLSREKEERGVLWTVLASILMIVLALLAVL